jgi:ribosomal protein S27AE
MPEQLDPKKQFKPLQEFANMSDTPNAWHAIRLQYPHLFPPMISEWLYGLDGHWIPGDGTTSPPIVMYRDRLRAVWTKNDRQGVSLSLLYGFKPEPSPNMPFEPFSIVGHGPIDGLPMGTPAVNGISGLIEWKFECEFQNLLYELMKNRWRTKICPECGTYFIADRAQSYCSDRCSVTIKNKRALEYWNRTGIVSRERKQKQKAKSNKQRKEK